MRDLEDSSTLAVWVGIGLIFFSHKIRSHIAQIPNAGILGEAQASSHTINDSRVELARGLVY
jgi:hypothetical protein